jgi:signal peptidase I
MSPPPNSPWETGATVSRPKRHDYRLRGLDLGAHNVAEGPLRPVRPPRKEQPSRRRRRRLLIQWAVAATAAVIVALLLRATVVQPYSVPSSSMVPTLQVGNRILVVKSRFLSGPIKAGDIIVFHQPKGLTCNSGGGQSHDLVKRVIGLPGQTIWSNSETIYVDGKILNEAGWYNQPYGQLGATEIVPTKVPAESYFVMGDNRTDTCDSRSFGPVSGSSVTGTVLAIILRNGHPYLRFF